MKKYCSFFDGIKLIVIMMLLSNSLLFLSSSVIVHRHFDENKIFELIRIFGLFMYLITLLIVSYFILKKLELNINCKRVSIMKYFWVSIIITGLILISLKLIKLSNYLFSSILVGVASTEVNLLTIILILVPIVLLEEIIFRGVIFEGFLHRYKSWVAFILFYLVVYLIPLGLVKFINIISRSAEVRSFLKRNVDINFLFTHIVTIIVTLTIMWIFYISRDIKLTFFAKLLWELFILFFYRLANGHFFGILEKRDWWLLSGGIILFMLGIYYFYDYSKKGRII